MRILQTIYLLVHGWFPVKTEYGWRWYQRRGDTDLRLLHKRALQLERKNGQTS